MTSEIKGSIAHFRKFTSSRYWPYAALFLLVLVLVCQLWTSASKLSVTSDEADHLHAGYRYLQCRDFGWNPEHPPMAKMVAALPLLFMETTDPIASPCSMTSNKMMDFQVGHDFVFANPESILMAARMAVSILAVGLLVCVWFFAQQMFGISVAVVSGVMIAFEPNLLAHGSLVMTDVPATLGFMLSVYAFYAFLLSPGRVRLILVGLAVGITLSLKHSTLIIIVILPPLAAVDALLSDPPHRIRTALRNLVCLGVAMVIAISVLWAVYGFRYAARPDDAKPWTSANLRSAHGLVATKIIPAIERRRLLPQAYLIGLQDVLVESEDHKRTFILGQTYPTGRWFYFPVAALIKFTIPTLLLLVISPFAVTFWRTHKRQLAFLIVPAAVILASAMTYTINIGIRHILPVLPFLTIFGVAGLLNLQWNRRWITATVAALLLFQVGSSLMAFPNYLSYSNELWGGTNNTYKYLSDSNTDMGQALKMARDYVQQSGSTPCWLIQSFNETTKDYDLPCDDINVSTPPLHFTGTLIVSSVLVDGIMTTYGTRSAAMFKDRQPKKKLGGSALFVYDGTFDMTPIVAAQRLKLATSIGPRNPQYAINQATEVLTFDPKNGAAHAVLCYAYTALGNPEPAERNCNAALELMRQDPFVAPQDVQYVANFMRQHGLGNQSN